MKLQLRNILKIESADIQLGGLTVLTGENDSGKSTIGKILFSFLKALNNVRQMDRIKTVSQIRFELLSIRRLLRNNQDTPLLSDIQGLSVSLADKRLPIESFLQELEPEIDKAELTTRGDAMIRNRVARIQQYIAKLNNPELAIKSEFELISRSEFMEPLNSFGTTDGLIHFHDDTTDADGNEVDIKIIDGKVSTISLWGTPSIEEITYIESPVYLPILNTLRLSSAIPTASFRGIADAFHKENLPFHLADMAEKILSVSEDLMGMLHDNPEREIFQPILNSINSVMGGEFVVNIKTRQLSFKQNGHVVPPVSVASGIKSFGVLQRLIQTDNVSTSKMLVWDEPEIHLHPQWQIVFCQLIVELVAKGIPVVVSSHSPYFVQGLRYFAAARGIERDVRYYMAEKSPVSGLSVMKEVTDDLNQVFTLLAAPLREIINVYSCNRYFS